MARKKGLQGGNTKRCRYSYLIQRTNLTILFDMPRVVVIDDEPMVGELTGAVLGMKGYDVHVASSGETGIRLILESLPDAVVCDVRMPEIGGEEVIRAIKSQPA